MKLKPIALLIATLGTVMVINGCSSGSSNNQNTSQLSMTLEPVTTNSTNKISLQSAESVLGMESAICQNNTCTWSNSANQNIASGQSIQEYCTGTNKSYGGTSTSFGKGAYNMSLPSGIAAANTGYGKTDVILELFNTPFESITTKMLSTYAAMGYTSIWISPPQYNAYVPYSGNYAADNIPAWYGAYQPIDFGQIGNESNPLSYGNATQLATLVNNAHDAGLQVIVDVAIHQFAQPGAQTNINANSATKYYETYSGQTYSYSAGNTQALSQFWWPQTKVSGYIPFGNTATTCASFANNTNGVTALWANNPNPTYTPTPNPTSAPWTADFSGTAGWFDNVLPSASNSSAGWSGAASCGTQSIFDGYAAWLMAANNTSESMTASASATKGFNVDGFRIDDISGQSVTFWNQLFSDTSAYNKSSNIFFGEYPNTSATAYNSYTAIKTASGNNISGNTMKMLNFPLLAGLVSALNLGGELQASLTSMISSSNAYQSNNNGTLAGVNAINLAMDQDTVPDSFSSRAMCPWNSDQGGNWQFAMNYYNAPLAYGIIMAIEAGTPYVFADLQAESNIGVNSKGVMTAGLGNGSVSYWNLNEVIAGIYFHNQAIGQSMTWAKINTNVENGGDNVAALTRGESFVFIVNKSTTNYRVVNSSAGQMKNMCYIDLMSHQIVQISGGEIASPLFVPGQSVMYFVPYTGAVPSSAGFTCKAAS